jgi:uncharacterized OB-fold protein
MEPSDRVPPFELPFTDWKPEYLYSLGELSPFFHEVVKNRRLTATRCPSCRKVWMPPRGDCPDCYTTTEWIPISGEGTVMSCSYCYFMGSGIDLIGYLDLPYVFALIHLDGTDTYMFHGIKPASQKMGEVRTGSRVKVVFREERRGTIGDFYFIPAAQTEHAEQEGDAAR